MDPEVEQLLQALYGAIDEDDGRWLARFAGPDGELLLRSHFQPIYSFPHRRPVGYEGLIRVFGSEGQSLPPLRAFESARGFEEQVKLDRLCRLLHVHNFVAQDHQDCWLFLNIHPAVFVHAARQAEMLARAVDVVHQLGLPMRSLVFEVTEDVMAQNDKFEDAVERARGSGCLLALDDFGAGHSNFDRIWRIKPEIVKLDRGLLNRAMSSRHMARVLTQMVSLLHECGALVLLEGVETRDEALLSLDSGIDLVQGYAFGRPQADLGPRGQVSPLIEDVWSLFDDRHLQQNRRYEEKVAPYQTAVVLALPALQQGRGLAQACQAFLQLPGAQLCYLLDEQGCEIGERVMPPERLARHDERFAPLERAGDARWARRPYCSRALAAVGEVQVSRPYLSLHGARLCVTVSLAFWESGRLRVLCCDVDWGLADSD